MNHDPKLPLQKEIQNYLIFIKRISPLLSDDELAWHATKMSISEYKKKDVFIEAGELQTMVGFVSKGLMRSYYTDPKGNEVTQQFIPEGKFASHYSALLSNQPSRFNFQCLEDTTLIKIPFADILNAYNSSHAFERFGRIIAEKICQTHHLRLEGFLFETAEQRYKNFISDYPSLFMRVSITHLCSYLGVERQTLTRIRQRLAKT